MACCGVILLRAPLEGARCQATWEQIVSWDAQLRERCLRFRRTAQLVVDPPSGEWWRIENRDRVRIVEGVPVEDFRSGGKRTQGEQPWVQFKSDGSSDSYALRLAGEEPEVWHMVCGGSGKVTKVDHAAMSAALAIETVP